MKTLFPLKQISYAKLKEHVPVIGEKDAFLKRKELAEIYGNATFKNYIRQMRSIKNQDKITFLDKIKDSLTQKNPNWKTLLEKKFTKNISEFSKKNGGKLDSIKNDLLINFRINIDNILLTIPEYEDQLEYLNQKIETCLNLFLDIISNPLFRKIPDKGKIQLFIEILKSVIYQNYSGELVAGYGGSEDALNVRIPTYILPQLLVIRSFLARQVTPPKLRILNAHSIAVLYNQMDASVTKNNAETIKSTLHEFIKRFFPDCLQFVEFTIPEAKEFVGSDIFNLILKALKEFATHDPDNKQIKSLLQKSKKHNVQTANKSLEDLDTEQKDKLLHNSLCYVACHIVETCFGDVRESKNPVNKPFYMIKFGGDGENDFNFFEEMVASNDWFMPVNSESLTYRPNTSGNYKEYTPIQVNLNIANLPPYYNHKEVDTDGNIQNLELLIEDFDSDKDSINIQQYYQQNLPKISGDIQSLEKAGINMSDYTNFLKNL